MSRTGWPLKAAFVAISGLILSVPARAKEKTPPVDPNDPTLRLYQILDNSYNGKLQGYFLLADVFKDEKNQEFQHVLKVEYDKTRFFGRFRIFVRSIGKPTEDQLKAYDAKALYEFGSDSEKFEKIDPGTFGKTGDLYLRSDDDRPLASAPVTDAARKEYETLVTQYLIPALQKKQEAGLPASH